MSKPISKPKPNRSPGRNGNTVLPSASPTSAVAQGTADEDQLQSRYSDDQLRLAARLYYLDGLSQMEVAEFVKVSQAKISRLLSLARKRGIVRISIDEYEPRDHKLETALQRKFDLKTVAVIKTMTGATADETRKMVGRFGASVVASLARRESTIAISGGRTLRELIPLLPENKELRVTVIQAMGSIDASVGPLDAFELGRSLARRWGGSFSMLNSPAFVPDKKTRDALLNLPQIRGVYERLGHVDLAMIGIGTLDNSVFVERPVLRANDLDKLARQGAVGEICGRFYDEKGRECDSPWRDRVIGMELDQLRRTPEVLGIIAGGNRSAAIKAAIRGGLLKSLVMDDHCARALLAETAPSYGSEFKTAK